MKNLLRSYITKLLRVDIKNFNDDALATFSLAPIQNELKLYYPYTGSALDLMNLKIVLNDIVIHQRKNIVELGAGISTVYIAALLRKNKIKATFTTIEENQQWVQILSNQLKEEGLSEYSNVIYAPIENEYYSKNVLENVKQNLEKIDCLIVDAPLAMQNKKIRKGAVPNFIHAMADNFSIFLDDCDRAGEKEIIEEWNKTYNLDFLIYNRLGIYIKCKDNHSKNNII